MADKTSAKGTASAPSSAAKEAKPAAALTALEILEEDDEFEVCLQHSNYS